MPRFTNCLASFLRPDNGPLYPLVSSIMPLQKCYLSFFTRWTSGKKKKNHCFHMSDVLVHRPSIISYKAEDRSIVLCGWNIHVTYRGEFFTNLVTFTSNNSHVYQPILKKTQDMSSPKPYPHHIWNSRPNSQGFNSDK